MQLAAFSVDDRGVAGFDHLQHAFDLGQRGNAERACHDGDMARGATLLQHETAQALPVVVEKLGRPHGAGDHDGVLGQAAGGRRPHSAREQAQ